MTESNNIIKKKLMEMVPVRRYRLTVALTLMLSAGLIVTLLPTALAQKPGSMEQPDLAVNEPENPPVSYTHLDVYKRQREA